METSAPYEVTRVEELSKTTEMCLVTIAVIAWFIFGWGIGACTARLLYQTEAVKRNAAEWVVDQSGRVEFKWKEVEVVE